MRIVIDIPEEEYERLKEQSIFGSMVRVWKQAIKNGTPLPDGVEILTKEAYSDLCTRAAEQPEKRTEERTETHACDCISRQAVLESLETDCSLMLFDSYGNLTFTGERIIEAIKRVPSVEPERNIDLIDREIPIEEYTDCVSKKDVIKAVYDWLEFYDPFEPDEPDLDDVLGNLPPVEPEKKFIEKVLETLRDMDDAVDVICNLDVDAVLDRMEIE